MPKAGPDKDVTPRPQSAKPGAVPQAAAGKGAAQRLLQLQRTAGNRAVARAFAPPAPIGPQGGEATGEIESAIGQAKGGGQALDGDTASEMAAKIGTDFKGVRVHTDGRAHSINRSLGARAATVGNDIFFSRQAYAPETSPGKQLLAHELTHVAQQSSGVQRSAPVVQRELDKTSFKENTNKGMMRRRGEVLSSIDGLMTQYNLHPFVVRTEADRLERIKLLRRIKKIAGLWISRHDVYAMFDRVQDDQNSQVAESPQEKAVARDTAINSAKQPDSKAGKTRQGKYAVIIDYLENSYLPSIEREIVSITDMRSEEQITAIQGPPVRSQAQLDAGAKQATKLGKKKAENTEKYAKLKSKFASSTADTGKLFGSVIPGILSVLAPGPGDLGKFTLDVQIPLEGASIPWFVGGKIYLEGERKEANEFKSKFKASFKTGPKFAVASLYGEVGAQIEAQAQTPGEIGSLFSYGMYRRFRESNFVPRGVTSYMWGGRKNTLGYQRAEKWAGNVEKDVYTTDDNAKKAYVDLGGYAGVGGGGEISDSIKATGAVERYKGRRYNKHTIETAKGGLGKTQFTKHGKQASLGQGSRRYELGGAISASMGIGGSGDFKFKLDQVKAVSDPKVKEGGQDVQKTNYKGHYKTQKAELELNAMVNVPVGGDLVEKIVIPLGIKAGEGIRNAVQLYKNKQNRGEMAAGMGVEGLEEAAGSFTRNIEVNQIAQSGFLGDTGHLSSAGKPVAHDAVAGLGKNASTGGGAKLRVKITKEHEFDLTASKWKLQGDLYSVNKLGASFAGNKVMLDKSTRMGLMKWETGGKMKLELLGMAATREANKANNNKMEWGIEKQLKQPKQRDLVKFPRN